MSDNTTGSPDAGPSQTDTHLPAPDRSGSPTTEQDADLLNSEPSAANDITTSTPAASTDRDPFQGSSTFDMMARLKREIFDVGNITVGVDGIESMQATAHAQLEIIEEVIEEIEALEEFFRETMGTNLTEAKESIERLSTMLEEMGGVDTKHAEMFSHTKEAASVVSDAGEMLEGGLETLGNIRQRAITARDSCMNMCVQIDNLLLE
ncbi:hypothetical protein N7456_007421 [Penicillium angulare]|uniref:Uncharacterized protein n=1 Tax=Penicillium angulare TaxID=116970 RepID=A0A9W9FAW6_9EURO|nr:hypothetical protein N7456_007421 [Penicillium angulare]